MIGEPTIVVEFGEEVGQGDRLFVVELDEARNLDSAGEVKTSFHPGDNIYFQMHYDATKLKIVRMATTDGEAFIQNKSVRSKEIDQLFVNDKEITTPHVPNRRPNISWYGKTSPYTWKFNTLKVDSYPVYGKINYNFDVTLCLWKAPTPILSEDDTWPIAVVVYVEAVEGS